MKSTRESYKIARDAHQFAMQISLSSDQFVVLDTRETPAWPDKTAAVFDLLRFLTKTPISFEEVPEKADASRQTSK